MTKTVTRYRKGGIWAFSEDVSADGQWVLYEDIKHLLTADMTDLELLRQAVAVIKRELYRGGSSTHLPADSFIENAARAVLAMRADEPSARTWAPKLGEYVRVSRFDRHGRSVDWRVHSISTMNDGEVWFDLASDNGGSVRARLDEIEPLPETR
jgi:hypothetical protein